jgi:hypothetical protein
MVVSVREMMKKALIVYYSQSGQLFDIVASITQPLETEFELVFEEIKPKEPFPFPWTGTSFYQVFPESVQEIKCELEPLRFDPEENFDLIILAYQVWYLSPSIPFSSFLQTDEAMRMIRNKPVITIIGCRNMWIMSQERIKKRIINMGGRLIGNIVLIDRHQNLVSVVTIIHWMIKGERNGRGLYKKLFPSAGVSEKDIRESAKFGEIILQAFKEKKLEDLQDNLFEKGAVHIKPVLLSIEKRGYMMFRIWSEFILKKGEYGDPSRERRLKCFKYYLFTVIYLLSPIGSVIFYLIHKLNYFHTRKRIDYYSHNKLK